MPDTAPKTAPAMMDLHACAVPALTVKAVPVSATLPLRVAVLWPDAPHKAHIPGEEAMRGVTHLAAYDRDAPGELANVPIGVISMFVDIKDKSAQFRKFAVAPEYQRRGVGTVLLHHAISKAARTARAFYHHVAAQKDDNTGVPFRIYANTRLASRAWYEARGLKLALPHCRPKNEQTKEWSPFEFPDVKANCVFYRGGHAYAQMETVFDASKAPFVVGAGFGRTGTMSLKLALDKLGMRCYHMAECMKGGKNHDDFFMKLVTLPSRERVERLREFMNTNGFLAAVDFPACAFWRTLCFAFPGAVVCLTRRDFDKWFESVYHTINRPQHDPEIRVYRSFHKMLNTRVGSHIRMVELIVWDGTFGAAKFRLKGHEEDRERIRQIFDANTKAVQNEVPDACLVDMPPGKWAPLVSVLGVSAPKDAFPHVNDTKEFQRYFFTARSYVRIAMAMVVGGFVRVFQGRRRK